MSKIGFLAALLAMTALFNLGSSAGAAVIDRIVAVVNDDIITLSEIQEEDLPLVLKIKEVFGGEERQRRLKEVEKQTLEMLIDKKLMLQDAQKENATVTSADVNSAIEEIKKTNNITTDEELRQGLAREHLSYEAFRRRIEEQLIILKITTRKVKSKLLVNEEEVKKYYQEHQSEFELTPEYKIRLVFFKITAGAAAAEIKKAEDKSKEALSKLKAGADFAELAKKYSEDVTAAAGGDLGFVKSKDMQPELEKACQQLEKGQISEIIKGTQGLYIIRMEDKHPFAVKTLAEVAPEIREKLNRNLYEQRYREWIKELRDKAYIDIRL